MGRMYEGVRSWSPFIGCWHGCVYCKDSFQRQMKRRRRYCYDCYLYTPHFHEERLKRVPSAKTIFCCAFGDIAFASLNHVFKILEVIEKHHDKTFYIQSKRPYVFTVWEHELEKKGKSIPDNVILGTTIESNRQTWEYKSETHHVPWAMITYNYDISRAPDPHDRYRVMRRNGYGLKHERRFVTIEPILDFDMHTLVGWIHDIDPEFVYVGYDNHDTKITVRGEPYRLPEPSLAKTELLIAMLEEFTVVKRKTLRRAWWENSKTELEKVAEWQAEYDPPISPDK